ncbi:hypothetical protein F4775DRAFT_553793 [Biscogniauxia sp. FL1348]|nr:hypothetical protein F4775DRAFT_553793 [Biscogniauxia sp. FL1348]
MEGSTSALVVCVDVASPAELVSVVVRGVERGGGVLVVTAVALPRSSVRVITAGATKVGVGGVGSVVVVVSAVMLMPPSSRFSVMVTAPTLPKSSVGFEEVGSISVTVTFPTLPKSSVAFDWATVVSVVVALPTSPRAIVKTLVVVPGFVIVFVSTSPLSLVVGVVVPTPPGSPWVGVVVSMVTVMLPLEEESVVSDLTCLLNSFMWRLRDNTPPPVSITGSECIA